MNILDENILESERRQLARWGVPFRQIGYEVGKKGISDEEIISFLLTLPHPTFFTQDWDSYKPSLCHTGYCLVFVDVKRTEAATFMRRVLRHPEFGTQAKRMAQVLRASHSRITVWRRHAKQEERFDWTD